VNDARGICRLLKAVVVGVCVFFWISKFRKPFNKSWIAVY
jgi:hypothetical protein